MGPEDVVLKATMGEAKDIKTVTKGCEWHKEGRNEYISPVIVLGDLNGPLVIINYAEWRKARAILNMFSASYMTPSNAGMFYPKQAVTRAEIATILYRVMQS